MQYNPLSIILTILGLYLISYILITLFTFIHLGFTKHAAEVNGPKVFFASALISLAWIFSTFISIVTAASFGLLAFTIISLVLIFAFSYFVSIKILNIKGRSLIIYSVLTAVIFNPGWLTLFKVL